MEFNDRVEKLERVIRRIFKSIDTIIVDDIKVKYIGRKTFDETIDKKCLQFHKNNSDNLHFELLIPKDDHASHKMDIKEFTNQIIFKYNVENVSCFINHSTELDEENPDDLSKNHIFEVACIWGDGEHKVYVDIDPDAFFE